MSQVTVRRDVLAFLMALAAGHRTAEGEVPGSLWDLPPQAASNLMDAAGSPEDFLRRSGFRITPDTYPWTDPDRSTRVVTGPRSTLQR